MLTPANDWLDFSYHVKGSAPLQEKRQLSSTWTSINITQELLSINESLKWGTKVNFFNASN